MHFEEDKCNRLKSLIGDIRQAENETDLPENELKKRIFQEWPDPAEIFSLVRPVEIICAITDYTQNAVEWMRTNIAL